MTQIFIKENGVLSLGAVSREEDLNPPRNSYRCFLNPPPEDGRCEVCGKHMSELKPFGGPGDPLVGDFSGELLVKRFRPAGPYIEEAEKAGNEYVKTHPEIHDDEYEGDPLPWFINKFGKEKGEELYWAWAAHDQVGKSWECRDCIILDDDEYWK
jgi:hypothetical protein